jgi:peptide deformylase
MEKLTIVKFPDPILRKAAEAVERVDNDLRRLAAGMFEAMYDAPGIGLAAPQVGVSRRLLVLDDARNDDEKRPLAMINPEILSHGPEMRTYEEGCLSIPDVYAEVDRPNLIRVRFLDLEGREQEQNCEGLISTIVQHEIDHLNGVLFIDHLSRLRRDLLVKKFYKARRENAETV